jgi:tctex1 domain-containing protein 2
MATTHDDAAKITELSYREKVPVAVMKEILHDTLLEKLVNQQYEGEKCNEAAKTLADLIRNRLKNLGYDRYKFVVQVLIGERREQGVYFGTRCFWDVNTDNQASDTFTNVRHYSMNRSTYLVATDSFSIVFRTIFFAQQQHSLSIYTNTTFSGQLHRRQ